MNYIKDKEVNNLCISISCRCRFVRGTWSSRYCCTCKSLCIIGRLLRRCTCCRIGGMAGRIETGVRGSTGMGIRIGIGHSMSSIRLCRLCSCIFKYS